MQCPLGFTLPIAFLQEFMAPIVAPAMITSNAVLIMSSTNEKPAFEFFCKPFNIVIASVYG